MNQEQENKKITSSSAQLTIDDKKIDLPVYRINDQKIANQQVIDVRKLTELGIFTLDPGFAATASCRSTITFIDGQKGQLLHRGFAIEDISSRKDYISLCYLLLNEKFPNSEEKNSFIQKLNQHNSLPNIVKNTFQGFDKNAHPMAMMMAVMSSLAAYYHNGLNIYDEQQRLTTAYRLVAKMPIITAMCFRHNQGLDFVAPTNKISYTANFLQMLFDQEPHETVVKALDTIFILHADHEQNASTSSVRLTGSSGANPFACIAAGIAALWGPSHGGANEAVINMLTQIGDEKNIDTYIKKAKDKNDPFRLMGFGHRVYKNFDPRAKVMRDICKQILDREENSVNEPLFKIARKLEKIALEDSYFIEKKLYPNVDFYSGIVLKALNIPTNMFTAIFALARTIGWISHWHEMLGDSNFRIGRPRQLYIGNDLRSMEKDS